MARNKEGTKGSKSSQDEADLPGNYNEKQFLSYVNLTAHQVALDLSHCN